MDSIERIKSLVEYLNKCCDEYYNGDNPTLSDAQYDKLFDELSGLEKRTGFILSSSPTQRAGYEVLSELPKVNHSIPLLSLAKTKDVKDIRNMAAISSGYLGLKMDGLTVKLTYKNGELYEASTRGDGSVGEIITHNAKVFENIPKKLPKKADFVITGEAYIDIPTFEQINENIENDEEKYSTPRNLAAGSVRQMDSRICKSRHIKFMPFSVLEGMDEINSKYERLEILKSFGFNRLPTRTVATSDTEENILKKIGELKSIAEQEELPIDGIVFTYDDASFSKSLGKTSHHFKDGIAYKFGDPTFKTRLKNIIWNISRTGQLTPIAEFEKVSIDNTEVERASLHNMTFIKNLKLNIGDEILVSKRNMIIPHVEENLTEKCGEYRLDFPLTCPVCGEKTVIETTSDGDKKVEVLYCKNQLCPGKNIKKFTHFVSKPAMNIDGLSEATLTKFIKWGWLKTLPDIYNIKEHISEIESADGFGKKSAENIINSIEQSKETAFSNFLVALNIEQIGKNAAKILEDVFEGDIERFYSAIKENYDFSALYGFGDTVNQSIFSWFSVKENISDFLALKDILKFKEKKVTNADTSNIFYGKTVVITGTFEDYSRDELTEKVVNAGGKVTGSVSKKTDYVLCGENPGSKLSKAEGLGVKILRQGEFTV